MSRPKLVISVVEGQTEEYFITKVVAPYLRTLNIIMSAKLVSKKGQNGGDVTFDRVKKDMVVFLWQQNITAVSYFVDYYGLSDWPKKDTLQLNSTPQQIADTLNHAALDALNRQYPELMPLKRIIPFMAVHEFESLLFSDSTILAESLGISQALVDKVLQEFDEKPEQINNSRDTAPSKRLMQWKRNFKKTTDGIMIAQKIGLNAMRQKCPLFDAWLCTIEQLEDA